MLAQNNKSNKSESLEASMFQDFFALFENMDYHSAKQVITGRPAVLTTAQSGAVILKADRKDVANLKIIQYNKSYEKFE